MSIRITDSGEVLIGPSGDPSEDADCCCGQADCSPCEFRILNVSDFSQIICGDADSSSDIKWDGSLCLWDDPSDQYTSYLPFAGCATNRNLSINGYAFSYAIISPNPGPGTWRLQLVALRPDNTCVTLWIGDLVSVSPVGIYVSPGGGSVCSDNPATLEVISCN